MATGVTFRRGLPTDTVYRRLAYMQLANAVGEAATAVVLVVYLASVRQFAPTAIAVIVALMAISGMLGAMLIGRLGDRVGHRRSLRVSAAAAAAGMLSTVTIDSHQLVGTALCVTAFADRGASTSRNAIVAAFPRTHRVRLRAYLRVLLNVGAMAGTACAGLAAILNMTEGYAAVLVLNAATYCAVVVLAGGLADAASHRGDGMRLGSTRGRPVISNWGYLATMAALAWYVVNFEVMGLAIALWLVTVEGAPTWVVPLAMMVNTSVASVLQMRLARQVVDVRSAGGAVWRSGAWVVAGLAMLALAVPLREPWAIGLVVGFAALLHVVGDMLGSAGQWEIGFGLADLERLGEYQGAAGFLVDAARALAPLVVSALLVGIGAPGLLPLVLSFVLAAWLTRVLAVRAAEATSNDREATRT